VERCGTRLEALLLGIVVQEPDVVPR